MNDKAERTHSHLQYALRFQALLRDIAGASNAFRRYPLITGREFWIFYSPAEVVSGIAASEELALAVDQAVAYFVLSSAAVSADAQEREGFFQRLKMKLPPIPGTRAHAHLAMTNYVREKLFERRDPDPKLLEVFAEHYSRERRRYVDDCNLDPCEPRVPAAA
jgi:hypothetical protein